MILTAEWRRCLVICLTIFAQRMENSGAGSVLALPQCSGSREDPGNSPSRNSRAVSDLLRLPR